MANEMFILRRIHGYTGSSWFTCKDAWANRITIIVADHCCIFEPRDLELQAWFPCTRFWIGFVV